MAATRASISAPLDDCGLLRRRRLLGGATLRGPEVLGSGWFRGALYLDACPVRSLLESLNQRCKKILKYEIPLS